MGPFSLGLFSTAPAPCTIWIFWSSVMALSRVLARCAGLHEGSIQEHRGVAARAGCVPWMLADVASGRATTASATPIRRARARQYLSLELTWLAPLSKMVTPCYLLVGRLPVRFERVNEVSSSRNPGRLARRVARDRS